MGMTSVIEGEYKILRMAKGKVNNIPVEVTLDESNEDWTYWVKYWVKIDRTDGTYGYSPTPFFSSGIFKFLDKWALNRANKYFDELIESYKLKEERE